MLAVKGLNIVKSDSAFIVFCCLNCLLVLLFKILFCQFKASIECNVTYLSLLFNFFSAQLFRSHLHVRVLHAVRHGAEVPEVRLVEAAHDHVADDPVCRDHGSRISAGNTIY